MTFEPTPMPRKGRKHRPKPTGAPKTDSGPWPRYRINWWDPRACCWREIPGLYTNAKDAIAYGGTHVAAGRRVRIGTVPGKHAQAQTTYQALEEFQAAHRSGPDKDCYTTPDGACTAPNCSLHGPTRDPMQYGGGPCGEGEDNT